MASNVNSYATLAELKAVLGVTATTDDVVMRKILEAASRAIESYCNRRFYCTTETKYFDGASVLWVDDLLSPTALKTDDDGDATFENTLVITGTQSDVLFYPLNDYPKTQIQSTVVATCGLAPSVHKGVEISGVWGYGDGITATPYVATPVTASATTATALSLALSADGTIEIGHTILCDSEQMYVTALGTLSATVERGVNKSTAAIHTGTAVSYYNYPRDIHQACIDLSVALYQNRAKKGIQSERLGDYSYTMSREMMNSILEDSIKGYRRLRV